MASEIVTEDSSFSSQSKSFFCQWAIRVLLTNLSWFVSGICYNQVLRFPFAHNSRSSTLTFNHFTSFSFSFSLFFLAHNTKKKSPWTFCVCRQWEIIFVKRLAGCSLASLLINLIIFWDHEFYWCWELFFSVQSVERR